MGLTDGYVEVGLTRPEDGAEDLSWELYQAALGNTRGRALRHCVKGCCNTLVCRTACCMSCYGVVSNDLPKARQAAERGEACGRCGGRAGCGGCPECGGGGGACQIPLATPRHRPAFEPSLHESNGIL